MNNLKDILDESLSEFSEDYTGLRKDEDLDEYYERKSEEIWTECRTFLSRNKEMMLQSNFFLKRGSRSSYSRVTFQEERKRRKVYSPELFFFYNKFKPSGYHSREELVPCVGGELTRFFKNYMNSYIVIPVGSDYQMYYNPSVTDFNYNKIIDQYELGRDPYTKLSDDIRSAYKRYYSEDIEITEGFESALKYTKFLIGDASDDMKPEEIMDKYNSAVKFVKKFKDVLQEFFPEVVETYNKYKDYFSKYFGGLAKTQQLEMGMKKNEVGLYAPDGFYYIENETILKTLLEQ